MSRHSALIHLGRASAIALFIAVYSSLCVAAGDKRVALVIGNNKYPSAALKNPVNDATAMAKKLREAGFEVILRTDSNQRQMTRAITEFGEKLTRGAVAVFYYAGHGLQARGRNYLVPIDADITSESAVSSETIDVERILDQLTHARLSMVILDACRNNPFERRFRSGTGSGLAQIDAPAGTLIAYATSPGKVALDGEGSHGTYTESLLKAIDAPGLRVEDVFKQVRINVMKATSNQQIPWESSSLTGDFVFRPKAAVAEQPLRNAQQDAAAAALREQMTALHAEIAKLREQRPSIATAPAVNEEDFKRAQKEAAALREQLTSLNAEIAKLRDTRPVDNANAAQQAQMQNQTAAAQSVLNAQVATLNTEIAQLRLASGPKEPTPDEKAAWQRQLSKLDSLRNVTFASALIVVLDIADADAEKVREFERRASRRRYNNALAFGIDTNGLLIWGGSYLQTNPRMAREIAIEFCERGGAKCRVVSSNGDFDKKEFLTTLQGLGLQPLEAVRTGVISSIAAGITESPAGDSGYRSGATTTNAAMGYTFARAAARP